MQCKVCGLSKDECDFYASRQNACKECVKKSVRENRAENIDYYRHYDRVRYRESADRQAAARASAASDAGIASRKRSALKYAASDERKARVAVGNAIRDGRLSRGTECFFCGSSSGLQAHHPDYSRRLDVFWLCRKCHGKLHTVNGDFLKASQP